MRSIPSIEQLRQRPAMQALEEQYGHAQLVAALRAGAAALRERTAAGAEPADPGAEIERAAQAALAAGDMPSLRRVINATGVIIHTNLGRAPLAHAAAARIAALADSYSNIEYDVEAGRRGRRDVHAEGLIRRLTGAEAAVVVNNNAAAAMLVLAAMATGREVVISRGELVEIGGGFRVPDVLAQSGAILREVGTTNRTRSADYAAALSDRTALILRVHPSNFRIEGFTERPSLGALVELGRRFGVPVVEDLGSGWLAAVEGQPAALADEPTVTASIAAGADVVMFSGDKLLGGPQAGIIAGTAAALTTVRTHPLMRALRVDKLTCAALEATLEEYAAGRARDTVPVARMLRLTAADLDPRADALARALSSAGFDARVVDGLSTIGGGSAPGSTLPTRLVALHHPSLSAEAFAAHLRRANPPIIARIESDAVLIDLRTIDPGEDPALATAIAACHHR